jgi:hypothetical protein
MKTDAEILEQFSDHIDLFLESNSVRSWRDETRQMYSMVAGAQWTPEDAKERQRQNKPINTVNRMAPIIKAVSGFEILNRTEIAIRPRYDSPNAEEEADADTMSDAIEVLQDDSDFHPMRSKADEDMLTCGIGATRTYFCYDNPEKPFGELVVDRIFPGYLLYDNTTLNPNFKGASWAGEVEIVDSNELSKEIEEVTGRPSSLDTGLRNSRKINDFLFFVDNITTDNIDLVFHYEWSEKESTRIIKNFALTNQEDAALLALFDEFGEEHEIDMTDRYITMSEKQYREFKGALKQYTEEGGLDYTQVLDPSKGERRKYYRARIARDIVLEASESWANDFTIQYKTGYFDEIERVFYGIGRAMVDPQRLLNTGVSDYNSYLQSVPKGGMYVEADGLLDPQEFKDTRANEQSITLLARDGLSKMQEKSIPQVPGGLTDFIGLTSQLLSSVVGLPPDFLGQVQSGNMTNSLFSKIIKQSYTVLANFFNNNKTYMRRQGGLFLSAVNVMAENWDGLMLDKATGDGRSEQFEVSKSKFAPNYSVAVIERPLSEDDELERFQQLAEVLGMNVDPQSKMALVQAWPYELEDKQKLMQLLQPPPPPPEPQPDPVMQQLLMAETQEKIARAELSRAKAMAEMQALKNPERKLTVKETTGSDGIKTERTLETTQ